MSGGLPGPLKAALDRALEGVSRRDLAERSAAITAAYRAGRTSAAVIRTAEDGLAYALVRLPATYAACAAVFEAVRRAAPGFAPTSLADAGAGPGGASWAALEAWPGIAATTLVDASPTFLDLAGRLRAEAPAALRAAALRPGDLADIPPAELVVASYALAEVPPARQAEVVGRLWDACEGVLVLVEPGTPDGYRRILEARTALIAAGARVLAPCPHDLDCPLTAPDWCHFAVRLPRSRDHRIAKAADAPFEDEKFAYLAAARAHVAAERRPRVLAPPRVTKPGIELRLCTPLTAETRFVGRRDKGGYRIARRLGWGDVWPG